MNKSALIRDTDSPSQNFPTPTRDHKIKAFPKVWITPGKYSGGYDEIHELILKQAKKYQIKNPKWASLYHNADFDQDYEMLDPLKKCKSLQLTSLVFDGRQDGASVGHFLGDVKGLDRISRHLKKLHLGAGVAGQKRFSEVKKWLLRLNSLKDFLLVPYWFPPEDEFDIDDWGAEPDQCKIEGLPRVIHRMYGQLQSFGIFGYLREDFLDRLDLNLMKQLKHFTIKTAFTREGASTEPEQFEDTHIGLIEKILKIENVSILTLYCQYDLTEKEFWVSLKDLIINVKRPLIVDVKIDYRSSNTETNRWFKRIFKKLPENVKVNYSIRDKEYFLSMPQGVEVVGEDDGIERSDDESEEDEEN